ncbi:hypothetical protein E0K89_005220 [Aquicoccus sp. SCR17]|nr:hypothetical protein [Carideicomes alvinocaridis]
MSDGPEGPNDTEGLAEKLHSILPRIEALTKEAATSAAIAQNALTDVKKNSTLPLSISVVGLIISAATVTFVAFQTYLANQQFEESRLATEESYVREVQVRNSSFVRAVEAVDWMMLLQAQDPNCTDSHELEPSEELQTRQFARDFVDDTYLLFRLASLRSFEGQWQSACSTRKRIISRFCYLEKPVNELLARTQPTFREGYQECLTQPLD